MSTPIWPSVLAFLVVIAAIPVALIGLQRLRFGASSRSEGLKVEQSLALGPRERIVIIQAGGERLLLGVTAQSVQMLSRLDPAERTSAQLGNGAGAAGGVEGAAQGSVDSARATVPAATAFAQLLGRRIAQDR